MAFDSAKFARYMEFRKVVLSEFRNYDVPVIVLKKENKKEAVCLVFEKVNTGGVPLSVFELITATYAADGVNLRDEWFGTGGVEGLRPYLARQKMLRGIVATDFFQGLSLLHTYQKRKDDISAGKTGKQIAAVSVPSVKLCWACRLRPISSGKIRLRRDFGKLPSSCVRSHFFQPMICLIAHNWSLWRLSWHFSVIAGWNRESTTSLPAGTGVECWVRVLLMLSVMIFLKMILMKLILCSKVCCCSV